MATFITSKGLGQTISISVNTSTGYWKYNHNGTDFGPFNQTAGSQSAEVLNANGEFTIISWDNDNEEVGGDVTYLDLNNNQLTSFDGTGLTSLTDLYLYKNQLTEFDGTPLTSLTVLDLGTNQLTEFDGTPLTSLTDLYLYENQLTEFDGTPLTSLTVLDLGTNQLTEFDGTPLTSLNGLYLYSNQLTEFDGTPLTSLTDLNLSDNQLTEFDGTPLTSLTGLDLGTNQLTTLDISNMDYLQNLYVNDNLLTASVNNSLLTKLAANELSNGWTYGEFYTTGGRTSAGTDDYDYLINEGWDISGADLILTPTFITSKAVEQFISLDIETSTGYWKYLHDGVWSEPFETGSYSGNFEIEITNENGEFTIISWDNDKGKVGGDVTYLDLNSQELTSFDGTGLTSLTYLDLYENQLTEFDGTPLTSLTYLDLQSNQLTSFDGTPLTSLTYLNLSAKRGGNQLTTLDISNMDYLQNLYVNDNLLTASVNNSLLTKLAANELSNDWDSGEFYTTGGRTSDGTTDYNYLINEGWTIEGADLLARKLRVRGINQLVIPPNGGGGGKGGL
jgi:Leucine-rich repeat (LRR) protein